MSEREFSILLLVSVLLFGLFAVLSRHESAKTKREIQSLKIQIQELQNEN